MQDETKPHAPPKPHSGTLILVVSISPAGPPRGLSADRPNIVQLQWLRQVSSRVLAEGNAQMSNDCNRIFQVLNVLHELKGPLRPCRPQRPLEARGCVSCSQARVARAGWVPFTSDDF